MIPQSRYCRVYPGVAAVEGFGNGAPCACTHACRIDGSILSAEGLAAEDERIAATVAPDPVTHPPHYRRGKVECIDAIEAATGDGFLQYCKGNAIKYLWRAGLKDDALQDVKKAQWYVARLIAALEAES